MNWSNLNTIDNFNGAFELFYLTFIRHFEFHFSYRKLNIKQFVTKKWIMEKVRKSSADLKNLHVLSMTYPDLENEYTR